MSWARAPIARLSRRQVVVGIRREDPTRIWERRCPLTPDAVHELVSKEGVQVHVEHCDRRIFPDSEFIRAGANIVSSLKEAHIHLGVKEPPLDELITTPLGDVQRTHMMFSHTAKAQSYNMPLLFSFLDPCSRPPRLVDFEMLTDDHGRRTVGFGWFAGFAGVFESLVSTAQSHLHHGIASPFLYTPRPHSLPSLDHLRAALRGIGTCIATEGTPKALGPFVIGLTGTGNVAKGCLDALSELPIQSIAPDDLPSFVANPDTDLRKVYLVHAKPSDYFVNKDNGYSREEYYAKPNLYKSVFSSNIAPYLTLFLNGGGWAPGFPRLMSGDDLRMALSRAHAGWRMTNIGDISCDPEGGLEFMTHATTLSDPSFSIRPSDELPEVRIMSVDILPTSIPLDASKHFSSALLPYLRSVVASYAGEDAGELGVALDRATIALDGQLTEKHAWLAAHRPSEKHVLILGSGMVAGPVVDKIAENQNRRVTIASNSLDELEALTKSHANASYVQQDLSDLTNIVEVLKTADVVISLLPATYHPKVAELCIEHKKHLVTASYISDEMKALHSNAEAAGVTLLNEIGLDPGIDHLTAISMIKRLQAENKEIVKFASFCGGLPDFSVKMDHPLKYKFSWNPRGALSGFMNPARYLNSKGVAEVKAGEMSKAYIPHFEVNVNENSVLEAYPNRNSMPYIGEYELDATKLRQFIRGTLRCPGFCTFMEEIRQAGFLDTTPLSETEWAQAEDRLKMTKFRDSVSKGALPNSLDYLAGVLARDPEFQYGKSERDMVLLVHRIETEDGEVHTAQLYVTGDERYSAMAKTVGLPVALAALLVLDGRVAIRGVIGPGDESMRVPILRELEANGIEMVERVGRCEVEVDY
ncbi:Saccharopine dehydrogenase-domain-containing protein [Mucidula mucida]|nr:Saccharopine dehydrogenase-domain-containing protein [Mucidula mucida]